MTIPSSHLGCASAPVTPPLVPQVQLQALRRRAAQQFYANRGATLSPRVAAPFYDSEFTQVATNNEWPIRDVHHPAYYSRGMDEASTPINRRMYYFQQGY